MAERLDQAFFDQTVSDLRELRIEAAQSRIGTRFSGHEWEIVLSDHPTGAISIIVDGKRRAICVSAETCKRNAHRMVPLLPVLAALTRNGTTSISLVDRGGAEPGVAYCESNPRHLLIPDADFLSSQGYGRVRAGYAARNVPWDFKQSIAFWRGGTSGRATNGWRSLPRVELATLCRDYPDLFDVGINRVTQITEAGVEDALRADGLIRDTVPDARWDEYRFHIDIDGNSNAWRGLFLRLLTGGAVLKVASPSGFRQWYYDRLVPWQNFVPVSSDMSDLVDKTRWLLSHDEHAKCIGAAGRELALSLDYDKEIAAAGAAIGNVLTPTRKATPMSAQTQPSERMLPILISAPGRSGTTLLMRILNNSPSVVIGRSPPYEVRLMAYYAYAHRVLTQPHSFELSTHPDRLRSGGYSIGFNPYSHPSFAQPATRSTVDATTSEAIAVAFRASIMAHYSAFAQDYGLDNVAYLAEKNDNMSAEVEGFVDTAFPGAKHIYLIRDPRDLYCSHRSYFKTSVTDTAQAVLRAAKQQTLIAPSENHLILRYEDLVSGGNASKAALEGFLGVAVEIEAEMLAGHGTAKGASVGRWVTDMVAEDRLALLPHLQDTLAALGYV